MSALLNPFTNRRTILAGNVTHNLAETWSIGWKRINISSLSPLLGNAKPTLKPRRGSSRLFVRWSKCVPSDSGTKRVGPDQVDESYISRNKAVAGADSGADSGGGGSMPLHSGGERKYNSRPRKCSMHDTVGELRSVPQHTSTGLRVQHFQGNPTLQQSGLSGIRQVPSASSLLPSSTIGPQVLVAPLPVVFPIMPTLVFQQSYNVFSIDRRSILVSVPLAQDSTSRFHR